MRELFFKIFESSHFNTGIQITPFSGAHIVYMVLIFGGIALAQWVLFFLYVLMRRSAFEVETLAFFLCTMGLAVIATIVQLDMNVARTEQYIDSLLQQKTAKEKKPNVGAFIQNLTQALSKIQLAGISAVSERKETENEIVLTITFPK